MRAVGAASLVVAESVELVSVESLGVSVACDVEVAATEVPESLGLVVEGELVDDVFVDVLVADVVVDGEEDVGAPVAEDVSGVDETEPDVVEELDVESVPSDESTPVEGLALVQLARATPNNTCGKTRRMRATYHTAHPTYCRNLRFGSTRRITRAMVWISVAQHGGEHRIILLGLQYCGFNFAVYDSAVFTSAMRARKSTSTSFWGKGCCLLKCSADFVRL